MAGEVIPLGVFGPQGGQRLQLAPASLEPLRETMDAGLSAQIAQYLRSGVIIFAIMEFTVDVLERRFGVSGGSGILTDGHYYWRRDAAEYVEEYRIGIDPSAISWMAANDWRVPDLSMEEVRRIDSYLYALLGHPH